MPRRFCAGHRVGVADNNLYDHARREGNKTGVPLSAHYGKVIATPHDETTEFVITVQITGSLASGHDAATCWACTSTPVTMRPDLPGAWVFIPAELFHLD